MSYFELCEAIARGEVGVDAAVVVGCRSGEGHDLGVINGYLQAVLDRATVVVVEERSRLPRVTGAAVARRADLLVPVEDPVAYVPLSGRPDETSQRIARNVADLAREARVLMLGVGRVAEAVADSLDPSGRLRVITGAVGESTLQLASRGVLDDQAPIQAMSVVGPPEVVDWACEDSRVQLLPSAVVHSPRWLACHDGLVVVLGGLSVDPSGNLNAERAGARQVSGRGGAPDFAAGAHASRGGRVIVALPATSPSGASNLKDALDAITVSGALVDAVATEHGTAVRGTDERQWRRQLEQIFR
ncbi:MULTISPECIES: acetyl-CoA hydrolase/transferase C-terminal domain-containing protein [unclassified Nocardioides]|uniref:acetyl-CoA hydrolase/transferase C-terminal domain-containing protein n=1 Tax=unclassified Nocardioides TaxID=2615069 RepID=UPI00138F3A22|nr:MULTISPECIES: acetyl-CoA hydrolase/transferase C-terminal domain-containing protein [unclassified Nocardioides]